MRKATCCKSSPNQSRTDPLSSMRLSNVGTMKASEQETSRVSSSPLRRSRASVEIYDLIAFELYPMDVGWQEDKVIWGNGWVVDG